MESTKLYYICMGGVLLFCYLVQLGFAAYMTRRFLIIKKKARIMFVAVFYTFTITCTLARILNVIAFPLIQIKFETVYDIMPEIRNKKNES